MIVGIALARGPALSVYGKARKAGTGFSREYR